MQLALRTGIAPSVWAAEPDGIIETAVELLADEDAERAAAAR